MYKNTYNDRAKRPPAFFEKLMPVMKICRLILKLEVCVFHFILDALHLRPNTPFNQRNVDTYKCPYIRIYKGHIVFKGRGSVVHVMCDIYMLQLANVNRFSKMPRFHCCLIDIDCTNTSRLYNSRRFISMENSKSLRLLRKYHRQPTAP